MFNIRSFQEALFTEYKETNNIYNVIRLAVQYICNEISCGNLVEESKLKWMLDWTECKNATELQDYIGYLNDVKSDYEALKNEVKNLSRLVDGLY